MVYTLAAQLITSCPDNAAMLPVTAQSFLTSSGSPIVPAAAGDMIKLDYTKSSSSVAGPVKAVIYNGLGSEMIDCNDGMVTIPDGIQGYSYIILTNAGSVADVTRKFPSIASLTDLQDLGMPDTDTDVTAMNTVAGPILIDTSFDAYVSNPGFMNPYGA